MNKNCCICLEKMTCYGKVIFKCGHAMHLCCYIECLKNDTIFCPLCRVKIQENVDYYNFLNLKFSIIIKNLQKICNSSPDVKRIIRDRINLI